MSSTVTINENWESTTQTIVAAIFGVSTRAVRKWEQERGCPRNADGTFNLRDVVAWWQKEYDERLAAVEADATSDWLEEKRMWEAKLKEVDYQERVKEVIPAPFVRRGVATVIEQFKRGLLGQPTKLAATLASLDRPEDCQSELEREHRELLEDLKRGLEAIVDGGVDGNS